MPGIYLPVSRLVIYAHILSICTAYLMHIQYIRQIVATNARSVWVKVEYRRPFSGGSIGNHAQLSPTPIGDHVQLFPDHAQLHPAQGLKHRNEIYPFARWFASNRIDKDLAN
jgi:hypothetical protein